MKYIRRSAGYTWTDYKSNTQIGKVLNITPVFEKLLEYMRKCIQHVNKTPRYRLPGVMILYTMIGEGNMAKFWRDLWICETWTGKEVAKLPDRYMMMIINFMRQNVTFLSIMSKENFPVLKSLCYCCVQCSAVILGVTNSFPFKKVRQILYLMEDELKIKQIFKRYILS